MRKTRFVRVKLDYVLYYDEDLDGLPGQFAGVIASDGHSINDLIVSGLKGLARRGEWDSVTILPGAKFNVSLTPATRVLEQKLRGVSAPKRRKKRG